MTCLQELKGNTGCYDILWATFYKFLLQTAAKVRAMVSNDIPWLTEETPGWLRSLFQW